VLTSLAALLVAYLVGCFNTGYYLVRARTGRDLRAEGSGTAGATNTGRVLGRGGFILAMVGDVLKGAVVVGLAWWLLPGAGPAASAAVGVVAGHIHPVQLGFRGGKGLATAFGAGVVLAPWSAAVAAATALVLLALTRRKVLSALAGVVAAPVSALAIYGLSPVTAGLAAVVALVLLRHAAPYLPWLRPPPRGARASRAAD
jgi:acyl phosphate:glycerol-3-phosphate acyltransferase